MPRESQFSSIRPLMPGDRPPAPDRLKPEMRDEWQKIVHRMPADYFTAEQLPVLEELCRIIIYARAAGAALDANPAEPRLSARYTKWTSLMTLLAHRLRLTVQAQQKPTKAPPTGTDRLAPWARNGDGH
jgi:hypothetical protein